MKSKIIYRMRKWEILKIPEGVVMPAKQRPGALIDRIRRRERIAFLNKCAAERAELMDFQHQDSLRWAAEERAKAAQIRAETVARRDEYLRQNPSSTLPRIEY